MENEKINDVILNVEHLRISFPSGKEELPVVNDVSFQVRKGETLGLVGESGCGKSMTINGIMQTVPIPGKITGGSIKLGKEELIGLPNRKLRKIRGSEIAMIFQEPMTSLNPLMTCGKQIEETIKAHRKVTKKEAKERALELISMVGIPMPEKVYSAIPGELSGGMRQRIVIAMALCNNPAVLICDEPTTALDVTVQAQILKLIKNLKTSFGSGIIFITHDLGVIRQVADRVAVMYVGQIVEEVAVKELFENPLHPYTVGLMECIPQVDDDAAELPVIEGNVPMLSELPAGCLFAPRCPYATERCKNERPKLYGEASHRVRCFRYEKQKSEVLD